MKSTRSGRLARISLALAATLVLTAAVAAPTSAAKRTKAAATAESITMVMVSDLNGDGKPNWGDTITWDVSTTETTLPYVALTCYQNGAIVASGAIGYYDGYLWSKEMPLVTPAWTGGAASCTAAGFYDSGKRRIVFAESFFEVGA